MMLRLLLTLYLVSLPLYAFDLVPVIQDNNLGVRIKNISPPETFDKDVKSGLKNFLLFTFYLDQPPTKNITLEIVEMIVQYDLWDEFYSIKYIRPNFPIKTKQAKTLDDLHKELNILFFDKMFPNKMDKNTPFQIKATLVFNPIEQEKVKHIKKWVLKNSVQLPSVSVDGRTSVGIQYKNSNPLLETLFNQMADNISTLGAWTASTTSKVLTFKELNHEKK